MSQKKINPAFFDCEKKIVWEDEKPDTVKECYTKLPDTVCPEEDNSHLPPRPAWYPTYHLAPPVGWMNVPNGLIEFGGWFHFFYQHNPHDTAAAELSHWGHARSKDMLRWEHLPMALVPDMPDDEGGCWSGSAVDNNGTLTLLYTGNGREGQAICIATSDAADGLHFTKGGKVLDPPPGIVHFRDPKVFLTGDSWSVVVGAESAGAGQVRLYRSSDLRQWVDGGALAGGEVPNFFELGGKRVLLFSPLGVEPKGYLYRNLYQNGYLVGEWEPSQPFNIERGFTQLDHGQDFFGPQTFATSDGRRVAVAWLDMWETPLPEKEQGWAGMLSLPRELEMGENGRIVQKPLREVESLRSDPNGIRMGPTQITSSRIELARQVRSAEVSLTFNTTSSTAEKFGLHLGRHNTSGLFIYVDGQSGRLTLERVYPRFGLSGARSILVESSILEVRVFFDHSSVEVFAEGTSLSSRIYPDDGERILSLYAENGRAELVESTFWTLKT